MIKPTEDKIIVTEHPTACGRCFGQLTLNKPKALNALDLEMASTILSVLKEWQSRQDILFIVIDAVGSRAFCAGGDIVSMYRAMVDQCEGTPAFIRQFFTTEYELDFTIHTFPKPIVVIADGIVMGGGMGLLAGASHKVATENTILAMPEITIGLFPDVGASYFLPKLPDNTGLFLGLTAAKLNGTECRYLSLVDNAILSRDVSKLLSKWRQTRWTGSVEQSLSMSLETTNLELAQPNRVAQWQSTIASICEEATVSDVAKNLKKVDSGGDPWFDEARETFFSGSAITASIFFEQYKRGKELDLASCFRMELTMACRCAEYGELQEGIRALLIDKDNRPAWRFNRVEDVPEQLVNYFFDSPWRQADHPLSALSS